MKNTDNQYDNALVLKINSEIKSLAKKRKEAYFYAYRGDGDIFKQALGANLAKLRSLDKTKFIRPIIAKDEETVLNLEKSKKELYSETLEKIKALEGLENRLKEHFKKFGISGKNLAELKIL